MAKRKQQFSKSGISIPDYNIIKVGMKPVKVQNIMRDHQRLMRDALWYVHYEVDNKTLAKEFGKYLDRVHKKGTSKLISAYPDHRMSTVGKYAYIANRGAELDEASIALMERETEKVLAWVEENKELANDSVKEEKPVKKNVISIQDRMRDQVADLLGQWESYLDDWMAGEYDLKKFDPYKEMIAYQPAIKPAHAKIIQDGYAAMLAEAREVVEFVDEDIKEAYGFWTARKTERQKFLSFFEAIHTACETLINAGKATRKTRAKKAPSKDKLVAKLKFKESEPTLGLASINPISVLDASTLWVYNTKNRKLIRYVADPLIKVLSVKGTTITGFDEGASTQKTVRKPEVLKGAGKLARTKFDKLYNELTTTETKANGRLNDHCILVRVF
jgi:hypothetical protein